MRARLNPVPAQPDDESASLDDIIDQHVQDQGNTFIGDGGAESEAEELDEEDELANEEDDEEDSGEDIGEEEDDDDDEEDDEEEDDAGSAYSRKTRRWHMSCVV